MLLWFLVMWRGIGGQLSLQVSSLNPKFERLSSVVCRLFLPHEQTIGADS